MDQKLDVISVLNGTILEELHFCGHTGLIAPLCARQFPKLSSLSFTPAIISLEMVGVSTGSLRELFIDPTYLVGRPNQRLAHYLSRLLKPNRDSLQCVHIQHKGIFWLELPERILEHLNDLNRTNCKTISLPQIAKYVDEFWAPLRVFKATASNFSFLQLFSNRSKFAVDDYVASWALFFGHLSNTAQLSTIRCCLADNLSAHSPFTSDPAGAPSYLQALQFIAEDIVNLGVPDPASDDCKWLYETFSSRFDGSIGSKWTTRLVESLHASASLSTWGPSKIPSSVWSAVIRDPKLSQQFDVFTHLAKELIPLRVISSVGAIAALLNPNITAATVLLPNFSWLLFALIFDATMYHRSPTFSPEEFDKIYQIIHTAASNGIKGSCVLRFFKFDILLSSCDDERVLQFVSDFFTVFVDAWDSGKAFVNARLIQALREKALGLPSLISVARESCLAVNPTESSTDIFNCFGMAIIAEALNRADAEPDLTETIAQELFLIDLARLSKDRHISMFQQLSSRKWDPRVVSRFRNALAVTAAASS